MIRFEDFHNLEDFCPGGLPSANRFTRACGREAERGTCANILLSCKAPKQPGEDDVVFVVKTEQFQSRHFLGNVSAGGLEIRVCLSGFAVTFQHGCSAQLSKLLLECPYSSYSPFISALPLTV